MQFTKEELNSIVAGSTEPVPVRSMLADSIYKHTALSKAEALLHDPLSVPVDTLTLLKLITKWKQGRENENRPGDKMYPSAIFLFVNKAGEISAALRETQSSNTPQHSATMK